MLQSNHPRGGVGGGATLQQVIGLVRQWWAFILLGVALAAINFHLVVLPPGDIKKVLGTIPLDALVGILVVVFCLLEGWQRRGHSVLDLLDFLIVPVGFLFLTQVDRLPDNARLVGAVLIGVGLVIAVMHNEAAQGSGVMGRVDLTPLLTLSGLVLLARVFRWGLSPTAMIPGIVVVVAFAASLARETIGRNRSFSVLALGAGAIAGFSANSLVLLLVFAGTIVGATIAGRMSRVSVRPGEQMSVALGPISFAYVIPWDVVIAQLFVMALVPQFQKILAIVGV